MTEKRYNLSGTSCIASVHLDTGFSAERLFWAVAQLRLLIGAGLDMT
jgi:hypothetical protein